MRLMLLAALFLFACDCDREDGNIVYTPSDDRTMNNAISDARAHLHVFEAELSRAEPSKTFSLKKPFPVSNGSVEHMWLIDVAAVDGGFEGRLDNEPRHAYASVGQRYTVGREELTDWLIEDTQGRIWGGYTIRVVLDEMPPNQRAEVEKMLQPLPQP